MVEYRNIVYVRDILDDGEYEYGLYLDAPSPHIGDNHEILYTLEAVSATGPYKASNEHSPSVGDTLFCNGICDTHGWIQISKVTKVDNYEKS